MLRKLPVNLVLFALASPTAFVFAQIESTLPRKSAQSREAIQPTTTTAPLLKPKPPLNRPPRLTDGATDENGDALETRDEVTRPTEVLTNRRSTVLRSRDPDLVMATWIAVANHEEIALATIAAERSHSAAVREYAGKMVDEHQALLGRLRPYAPEAIRMDYLNRSEAAARSNRPQATEEVVIQKRTTVGGTPATVGPVIDRLADGKPPEADLAPSATRSPEDRPRLGGETDTATVTETRVRIPAARDFNFAQVEREVAAQGLATSKETLLSKTGADFDEWFLAQQIAAHKAMRDKLIVYQRYVSSDLGKVLAASEAATDRHLAQANELLNAVPRPTTKEPLATSKTDSK